MFKLQEFRKAHGMYQAQMAEVLGLTQSGISRMETEKIDLTNVQYERLYEEFGKEDVDAYRVDMSPLEAQLALDGDVAKEGLVEVIKKQSEVFCEHLRRQDDINARLMGLLEKIALSTMVSHSAAQKGEYNS